MQYQLLIEYKHQFGEKVAQYRATDHVILADTGEVIEFCDPRIQQITLEELLTSKSLQFGPYETLNQFGEKVAQYEVSNLVEASRSTWNASTAISGHGMAPTYATTRGHSSLIVGAEFHAFEPIPSTPPFEENASENLWNNPFDAEVHVKATLST